MERLRRIASFWNWLPAFRAVAETQHLPSASKELFVSAPALSRAIRLLEKDLGCPLFRRTGRRLELNDAGETMLTALRDSMRRVHEAMLAVRSEQMRGPIYLASSGVMTTSFVIPALLALRAEHTDLEPHVSTVSPDRVGRMLLRGELDVAFQSMPVQHRRLTTVHLGTVSSSVYCAPGHPLAERDEVSLEEVVSHEFVAPTPTPAGEVPDGWPPSIARRCGLHVDQMRVGREACLTGNWLAVLPDPVANDAGRGLQRLPIDIIPPTDLFAVHRPNLGMTNRAERVVEAVRGQVAAATV